MGYRMYIRINMGQLNLCVLPFKVNCRRLTQRSSNKWFAFIDKFRKDRIWAQINIFPLPRIPSILAILYRPKHLFFSVIKPFVSCRMKYFWLVSWVIRNCFLFYLIDLGYNLLVLACLNCLVYIFWMNCFNVISVCVKYCRLECGRVSRWVGP